MQEKDTMGLSVARSEKATQLLMGSCSLEILEPLWKKSGYLEATVLEKLHRETTQNWRDFPEKALLSSH
jgi:hypothetical protein